jgi:hypothetical protein
MKRFALLLTLLVLAVQVVQGADDRHPLVREIAYVNNLLLINDLQLNLQQLQVLLNSANTASRLVSEADRGHAVALVGKSALLRERIKALQDGTLLSADKMAMLADLWDAEQNRHGHMLTAVDVQIRGVQRTLSAQQAALVDWTTPAQVASAPDERAALDDMRRLGSRLTDARRLIETLRYSIAFDYSTTRIGRINSFLTNYFQPNTPIFDRAFNITSRVISDARVVDERDWPQLAPLFAARLLQRLALLDDKARQQAQARYNWWDMYYLLTDPQTPTMLQTVLTQLGAR